MCAEVLEDFGAATTNDKNIVIEIPTRAPAETRLRATMTLAAITNLYAADVTHSTIARIAVKYNRGSASWLPAYNLAGNSESLTAAAASFQLKNIKKGVIQDAFLWAITTAARQIDADIGIMKFIGVKPVEQTLRGSHLLAETLKEYRNEIGATDPTINLDEALWVTPGLKMPNNGNIKIQNVNAAATAISWVQFWRAIEADEQGENAQQIREKPQKATGSSGGGGLSRIFG